MRLNDSSYIHMHESTKTDAYFANIYIYIKVYFFCNVHKPLLLHSYICIFIPPKCILLFNCIPYLIYFIVVESIFSDFLSLYNF